MAKKDTMRLKLNGFFYSFISSLSIPSGNECRMQPVAAVQENYVAKSNNFVLCTYSYTHRRKSSLPRLPKKNHDDKNYL